MVHFTPDRRQFLTTGLAVGLSTVCGFGVGGATLEGKTFPMPFAGSRTVANFASGLFFCEDDMPISLSHALDAGLARTDVVPDSHAEERRRAKFFAWLAVRCIAPRTPAPRRLRSARGGLRESARLAARRRLRNGAAYNRQVICLRSSDASARELRLWRQRTRFHLRILCQSR